MQIFSMNRKSEKNKTYSKEDFLCTNGYKNILIIVCGSIAAIKIPQLVENLEENPFNVKIVVTENAKNFLDSDFITRCLDNADNYL
ncbi:hypothetical protein HZS_1885, partial [Henneguya salminicola]